ncbi:isochorismate synthase [Desertihabitans aurantiacus]|uniref:isochorismate synthase n=1 Tax=Desertihabitans aurantiacus TaxID=2282477 RepID=UPI001E3BA274|nr:isochorismate synthase [Desertihabitans aurantiacus]
MIAPLLVHSSAPVFVRSTLLPGTGLDAVLDLLRRGPAGGVDYGWLHGEDGAVGGGAALRWQPRPGEGTGAAASWWDGVCARLEHTGDSAGHASLAFGSFPFDPGHTEAAPVLVLPEWVLVHRHGETVLLEASTRPFPVPAAARLDALLDAGAEPEEPVTLHEEHEALDAEQWAERVARGVKRILVGDLDKVVLARQVTVRGDRPLPVGRLARRLHASYPRCWTFLVDGLVGASPEMLVRREEGLVTSRVLAGTIGVSGAAPETLGAALASSSKDLLEHEFAVASVASALAPYCDGMNVPSAPYVLELPNVLHLATEITAATSPTTSVLELVGALHPSAAVCGTPTPTARRLIAELESMDRGRYSGPVGWVDSTGDGAWAIALRCGQVDPDDPRVVRLYAGCGIVADSDPDAEVAESQAKLVPMRTALAEASAATGRVASRTGAR